MAMTADQLVTEIGALPDEVRADVIDRVLLESHGGQVPEHEQAWSQEIHRRIDAIREGGTAGIPGEEVSAKIQRIVGR